MHITASRLAAWWAPSTSSLFLPLSFPFSLAGDDWASSRPPGMPVSSLPFLHRCPQLLPLPPPQPTVQLAVASSAGLRSPITSSVSGVRVRDPPRRRAAVGVRAVLEEQQQWGNGGDDAVEDLGEALAKTRELVECAMFAAVAGLAYFLSNSLAIEVCFLLPAVCLSVDLCMEEMLALALFKDS